MHNLLINDKPLAWLLILLTGLLATIPVLAVPTATPGMPGQPALIK